MRGQVAIHQTTGGFSERWIDRCQLLDVPYKVVDCYSSDIISQLDSASGLMWHWSHDIPQDLIAARRVITTAELMGLKVFPNSATCWHFDDKIGQKYLLESVEAPIVPAYVFYHPDVALRWIGETTFPKVFKLARGAGSANVKLVKTASEAVRLTRRAFGSGFRPSPGMTFDFSKKLNDARKRRDIINKVKRLPRALTNIWRKRRSMGKEKGYIYFQDFMAGNAFDTRITVIGDRAFGFTRDVRPSDFRASGSGRISYDLARINLECVVTAFKVSNQIKSQSTAFDFVKDGSGTPRILEISYAYQAKAVHDCPGYWDRELNWRSGNFWPQDAILDDFLRKIP